jgi:glycosyltransferase involved in cell wall biosynthesis
MSSPTAADRSVVIVQSYVPSYRQPLFEMLRDRLLETGVTLTLVTSRPARQQKERGDEVRVEFQRVVHGVSIVLGGRTLRWKAVWRRTRGADLVVSELASGALENYSLAVWHRGRFATWGHGYATTTKPHWLDTALERWLMRRSKVFFAYTERGRRKALQNGLPDLRVVVLRNTVDTTRLQSAIEKVAANPDLGVPEVWGVEPDNVVCVFLGALDRSKRLDFLLQASELIWRELPTFQLLIAGDGPEREAVLHAANERPYLRYIGRVGDLEKAQLAAIARLMLNPGRVGLNAVDSFVMRTPIVTTDWPLHAPEFDYLINDENALVVADSVEEYSRAVLDLLRDDARLAKLADGCNAAASKLTMEALVDRFSNGILRALDG